MVDLTDVETKVIGKRLKLKGTEIPDGATHLFIGDIDRLMCDKTEMFEHNFEKHENGRAYEWCFDRIWRVINPSPYNKERTYPIEMFD